MYKFPVMITSGQMHMDDDVRARMTQATRGAKDGPYELLLREAVEWDVTQMRKYFHVLCKNFFKPMFKQKGHPYGEREIKEYFKHKYGDMDDMDMPISTSEYDFARYLTFINDIKGWTRDNWAMELPVKEEIE